MIRSAVAVRMPHLPPVGGGGGGLNFPIRLSVVHGYLCRAGALYTTTFLVHLGSSVAISKGSSYFGGGDEPQGSGKGSGHYLLRLWRKFPDCGRPMSRTQPLDCPLYIATRNTVEHLLIPLHWYLSTFNTLSMRGLNKKPDLGQ